MRTNTLIYWSMVPAVGMMLVAAVAVLYWRCRTHLQFRWFWAGAALWAVAVVLKSICAILTNLHVIGLLTNTLPYPLLVIAGGLFIGIQSSLFEIGLTLLAVLIWRQLARDAARGIGIGIGAGAFEAFLLGLFFLIVTLVMLARGPGANSGRAAIETAAASTPLFWLVGPVERIIVILCHASSRALVLLGMVKKRPLIVLGGFLLFTLLDGVAGAAHVSGILGQMSLWWVELALLPFALLSIPILRWCYSNWGTWQQTPTTPLAAGPPNLPAQQ